MKKKAKAAAEKEMAEWVLFSLYLYVQYDIPNWYLVSIEPRLRLSCLRRKKLMLSWRLKLKLSEWILFVVFFLHLLSPNIKIYWMATSGCWAKGLWRGGCKAKRTGGNWTSGCWAKGLWRGGCKAKRTGGNWTSGCWAKGLWRGGC